MKTIIKSTVKTGLKKRYLLMAAAVMVPLLMLGMRKAAQAQEWPFLNPPSENPFAEISKQNLALNLEETVDSELITEYLNFYSMNYTGVRHSAGYVEAGGEQLFVNVFQPAVPAEIKGTIVTMHGYFVHTGLIRHLIQSLLDAHYAVVAVDLPGHGLSSGPRASITEFGAYSGALAKVTETAKALPGPHYIVGHSTGGAGVWEYLLKYPDHPYQKAVLAAPLVRSAFWDLSMTGYHLGNGWLTELPRLLRPTSRDPEFIAMVRRDPLQYAGTPVQWVRALKEWNEHVIESYPPTPLPLLILQGTEDTVVDWAYNLPFLQRKFPNAQIQYLPGANHDLLWESPDIRETVFTNLLSFLNEPAGKEVDSVNLNDH